MVHVSKLSAVLILLAHHVIGRDEEQFGEDTISCPPDIKAFIAKYSAFKQMKPVTLAGTYNNNKNFRDATCNLRADYQILLDGTTKPTKDGIVKSVAHVGYFKTYKEPPCGLLIQVVVGQHKENRSTIACKLKD